MAASTLSIQWKPEEYKLASNVIFIFYRSKDKADKLLQVLKMNILQNVQSSVQVLVNN